MRSLCVILFFLMLLHVIASRGTNWDILSSHGLTNESLIESMHIATEAAIDNVSARNFVRMSIYQRTKMAEKFGGLWSCFTQTEPFHYSVLRRASIYMKWPGNKNVRVYCFK